MLFSRNTPYGAWHWHVDVGAMLPQQQHPFNGPLSRTTRVSHCQKGKTNLDLLEQETVSGSGISWVVCKTASRSRQITTLAPHLSFLQAGCPSCHPTNGVKAVKASAVQQLIINFQCIRQGA